MSITTPEAADRQATNPPPPPQRPHRVLVPVLLALATLALFLGAFAVWINRQALNTDNWTSTSGKLLADKQVNAALGAYLVNELFTNVDVPAALQQRLPQQLKGLAGPAAAGLEQVAERAAPQLLARPKVQELWVASNRAAHRRLLQVINGGGPRVSTQGGTVTLDLHAIVDQLARQLGVESQVQTARSKLAGGAGAQARTLAAQKLNLRLPPKSGRLTVMRSDQLATAQDLASTVKGLALVLPALAIILFALAIWLARGRRRRALRSAGWCFVAVGLALLLLRRVGGNEIVDQLVKVPSNKPAVHEVWNIATSLLYAIAVALVVYGVALALSAWVAGPTRAARFLRQALAPTLRESPWLAYGGAGLLLLVLVIWGPTPAFRQLAWVALFAGLLALAVTLLRRQAAAEFPDAGHGDAWRGMRARRAAAPQPIAGASDSAAPAPVDSRTLDGLERLVSLRDSGALTEAEFGAAKMRLMNGP